MTITNKTELMQRSTLEAGDRVEFRYKGKTHGFRVTSSHLSDDHGNNGGLITTLAMDGQLGNKYDIASRAYGYNVCSGDWPDYKGADYGAAWRLCLSMYNIIQNLEYGSSTTTVNSTTLPPIKASAVDVKFETTDEVCLKTHEYIKGRVIGVARGVVSVIWQDGSVLTYTPDFLKNLTKEKEYSLTKQKQTYNEYLQRQDLPVEGGQRAEGIGVSDRGSSPSVGRRHLGNEASFEDSGISVRCGQIRGTAVKY